MQRYFILWSQMSASSQQRDYLEARLHFVYSWMPTHNDSDPWLQVDFAITLDLLKLTIQGAPSGELFVKSFTVTYANSSGIFQNLTSGSILKVKINQQFHIIGYFVKKTQIGRNIEEITSIRLRLLPQTFWCDYKTLLVHMYPDLSCF